MSASGMSTIARYAIRSSPSSSSDANKLFSLVITRGSVVDFTYCPNPGKAEGRKAAIVNAANEACLGGGGVDGAISDAGGPDLLADRMALPIVEGSGIRCPTGQAVITGPKDYGDLGVRYVIHAVGPNYMVYDDSSSNLDSGDCDSESDDDNDNGGYAHGDGLLRSAYVSSLQRASEHNLEAVAFSLISSGVFRGKHSKREVLKIGVESITEGFVSATAQEQNGASGGLEALKEVHLCAFNAEEARLLCDICEEIGLEKE